LSTLRATRWRRAVQRRRSPRATGASASLISAIGQDPLGDEILKVAEANGVNTRFVTRARIGLPAGTVLVTVDANGNATYELVQPVAWDEIKVLPEPWKLLRKRAGSSLAHSQADHLTI